MLCVSLCVKNRVLLQRQYREQSQPVQMWLELLQVNDGSIVLKAGNDKFGIAEGERKHISFAGTSVVVYFSGRNSHRIKFKIEAPMTVDIIREKLIRGTV